MKGQSLFEVVFAIAIAAIIMIGVVSIATVSVRNTDFARNNSLATRCVQEASEWLRGQRDEDWASFQSKANGTKYCLQDVETTGLTTGSCSKINGTIFTRQVTLNTVDPPNNNNVEATISVEWSDAQGLHVVKSVARYTNWKIFY